jgi:hypothetical protein
MLSTCHACLFVYCSIVVGRDQVSWQRLGGHGDRRIHLSTGTSSIIATDSPTTIICPPRRRRRATIYSRLHQLPPRPALRRLQKRPLLQWTSRPATPRIRLIPTSRRNRSIALSRRQCSKCRRLRKSTPRLQRCAPCGNGSSSSLHRPPLRPQTQGKALARG